MKKSESFIVQNVSNSKNDEWYTPSYAIIPLIKYLKPNSTIWCPFDTKESYYVKVFEKNGFKVMPTHLSIGKDFFTENIECDYIISNPPYSKKNDVLKRLFKLGKPFAMLVGSVGLFEGERFNLFSKNEFELMVFNKRVSFLNSINEKKPSKNPPYMSFYVCQKILPEQIIFEKIQNDSVRELAPIIENLTIQKKLFEVKESEKE
jgi:hypothetical protein